MVHNRTYVQQPEFDIECGINCSCKSETISGLVHQKTNIFFEEWKSFELSLLKEFDTTQ